MFWSFFGVRKGQHLHEDAARCTPLQLILPGVVGGVVAVLALRTLVWFVVN